MHKSYAPRWKPRQAGGERHARNAKRFDPTRAGLFTDADSPCVRVTSIAQSANANATRWSHSSGAYKVGRAHVDAGRVVEREGQRVARIRSVAPRGQPRARGVKPLGFARGAFAFCLPRFQPAVRNTGAVWSGTVGAFSSPRAPSSPLRSAPGHEL